jgi:hypothetical protein
MYICIYTYIYTYMYDQGWCGCQRLSISNPRGGSLRSKGAVRAGWSLSSAHGMPHDWVRWHSPLDMGLKIMFLHIFIYVHWFKFVQIIFRHTHLAYTHLAYSFLYIKPWPMKPQCLLLKLPIHTYIYLCIPFCQRIARCSPVSPSTLWMVTWCRKGWQHLWVRVLFHHQWNQLEPKTIQFWSLGFKCWGRDSIPFVFFSPIWGPRSSCLGWSSKKVGDAHQLSKQRHWNVG